MTEQEEQEEEEEEEEDENKRIRPRERALGQKSLQKSNLFWQLDYFWQKVKTQFQIATGNKSCRVIVNDKNSKGNT